jgi:hypothetical protein
MVYSCMFTAGIAMILTTVVSERFYESE